MAGTDVGQPSRAEAAPAGRRRFASKLFRVGKRAAPVVISAGLVAWLVWTITPRQLAAALALGVWPWLVLATVVQVVVLFLWDTGCL